MQVTIIKSSVSVHSGRPISLVKTPNGHVIPVYTDQIKTVG